MYVLSVSRANFEHPFESRVDTNLFISHDKFMSSYTKHFYGAYFTNGAYAETFTKYKIRKRKEHVDLQGCDFTIWKRGGVGKYWKRPKWSEMVANVKWNLVFAFIYHPPYLWHFVADFLCHLAHEHTNFMWWLRWQWQHRFQ